MTLGKCWGGYFSEAMDRLPAETTEQVLPAFLKELEKVTCH